MSDFERLASPYACWPDHYREYSRVSGRAVPVPDVLLYVKPLGALEFSSFPVMFTVDSGADVTILPRRWAKALGYSLDGVDSLPGRGAGGSVYAYFADPGWKAEVRLCGEWTEIPVRFFASEEARSALLGRQGAFDALELVFVQASRVMYARRL
jgi:hypothetical protein